MAATQFYTSEYYLDTKRFRDLSVHFMNTTMRKIMEVGMFLTSVTPEDTVGRPLDPEFVTFSKRICADPAVLLARQKLRHLFMSKGECLIHCDLHTSNIFASQTEAKVIDMEYAFFGPFDILPRTLLHSMLPLLSVHLRQKKLVRNLKHTVCL